MPKYKSVKRFLLETKFTQFIRENPILTIAITLFGVFVNWSINLAWGKIGNVVGLCLVLSIWIMLEHKAKQLKTQKNAHTGVI